MREIVTTTRYPPIVVGGRFWISDLAWSGILENQTDRQTDRQTHRQTHNTDRQATT
jgi:hypothetical protein